MHFDCLFYVFYEPPKETHAHKGWPGRAGAKSERRGALRLFFGAAKPLKLSQALWQPRGGLSRLKGRRRQGSAIDFRVYQAAGDAFGLHQA